MNVDELRRTLRADDEPTAQIPVERIRRRARQIRVRRGAGVTVTVAAVVAVVSTLAVTLPGRGAGQQTGAPSTATGCLIDTGVALEARDGTQYHVTFGVTGSSDDPWFTVAYRDRAGELADATTYIGIGPHAGGDFSGKHPADPTHRFLSAQVPLGPHSVLDMGVYSRPAARISVASAGPPTDAHLVALSPNGWTLFWVRRDAAPLPDGATTTEIPYQGPEQVTLTAYAANGAVEQTVDGASEDDGRFIGLSPQSLANVGAGSGGMGAPPCPQPDPGRS